MGPLLLRDMAAQLLEISYGPDLTSFPYPTYHKCTKYSCIIIIHHDNYYIPLLPQAVMPHPFVLQTQPVGSYVEDLVGKQLVVFVLRYCSSLILCFRSQSSVGTRGGQLLCLTLAVKAVCNVGVMSMADSARYQSTVV